MTRWHSSLNCSDDNCPCQAEQLESPGFAVSLDMPDRMRGYRTYHWADPNSTIKSVEERVSANGHRQIIYRYPDGRVLVASS